MNGQSVSSYHWASKAIHWLSAITIIGLFALGYWMVRLDYYDPWYQTGPNWHRSVGIVLAVLTCVRIALYLLPKPGVNTLHSRLEQLAAKFAKVMLLVLLFTLFVSGYFISTATGDPIYVFDVLTIPSILQFDNLEEYAGTVHEYSAWALIVLAASHALAALKHHFVDKDDTLKRITVN